jgi:hypothetical protein
MQIMTTFETFYLCGVVAAFTLFAATLAFASITSGSRH